MNSVTERESANPGDLPEMDLGARDRSQAASLTRRLTVLAHLQPLLDIEKGKNQAARAGGHDDRDWSRYDMRLLELVAFDTLAVEHGMHPEGGVPRQVVEDAIAEYAERCAPELSVEDHRGVAKWLVERMLNYGDAAQGFDVPWVDPSHDYQPGMLRVRVLYEDLVDGEVVLKADDGAISLTLVGLDLDLEDRLIANEAVMKAQIDSGRWNAAEVRAEETRRLAAQYSSQIERFLRTVERDLRSVDWQGDVETKLDESRELIKDRVRELSALREHANRLVDDIDAKTLTQATAMMGYVDQARSTLLDLQTRIIRARNRFRTAQSAQGFAVSMSVGKIDVKDDVFHPLLALPAAAAEKVSENVVASFAGVTTPTVTSVHDVLSVLLARPRGREAAALEVEDLDLVEVDSPFERFDDETWSVAEDLLAGVGEAPVRLASLVDGQPDEVVLLVALCAMRCWGDRSRSHSSMLSGLTATGGEAEVRLARITLPDLELARTGEVANASS
jgi:hypothetical protein